MDSDQIGFSSEVVENVRFITASHAWQQFLAPSLKIIRDAWAESIIDPAKKRQDEHPDDYIRGCIATVDAFLNLPQTLIAEADAQAAKRADEQAQEDHFSNRATLGTP